MAEAMDTGSFDFLEEMIKTETTPSDPGQGNPQPAGEPSQVLMVPEQGKPVASCSSGPAGPTIAAVGTIANRVSKKGLKCSACPRAFADRKRLKAHWETAHAESYSGYECPHAGCTRTFHVGHMALLKSHFRAAHGYTKEEIASTVSGLCPKTLTNSASDGKATQVAMPARLAAPRQPPAARASQKKSRSSRQHRVVSEMILKDVIRTNSLAYNDAASRHSTERAEWKRLADAKDRHIRNLEAKVARLEQQLADRRTDHQGSADRRHPPRSDTARGSANRRHPSHR